MLCPKCVEQRDGTAECFDCHVPLRGGARLVDLRELHRLVAALDEFRIAFGSVNPRPRGWHHGLIQLGKKLFARVLVWYMRPLHQFNLHVNRSLEEIVSTLDQHSLNMLGIDHLAINLIALETRLAQAEERGIARVASMREQVARLQQQINVVTGSGNSTNPEVTLGGTETEWDRSSREDSRSLIDQDTKNDRTAYVIGLFGTGRSYINDVMLQNIGERAKYLRDTIRLHAGPTPMIYSGHATMKHFSRAQASPVVMSRILESVRSGFADVIFVYRHPLDSLLTNWVWWRTYIRDKRITKGISEVYKSTDDLCADLEENFVEFQAFAEGNPDFFAALPGPPFLSFQEFVEETELHLQSTTLALRLEDFIIDPVKEFSKIIEVMSGKDDSSPLCVARPRTKPYGHLSVQARVPRFRNFVNDLATETKRRIERIGYNLTGLS